MSGENGNGKKRLKARHWTYIGVCALIAGTAAAWQGGKYLWAQTAEPFVKKAICATVHDSLKPVNTRVTKIMFSTQKTQTYMETMMPEETKAVAETQWKRDSVMMQVGIDAGR
jgi:hypothetical protein